MQFHFLEPWDTNAHALYISPALQSVKSASSPPPPPPPPFLMLRRRRRAAEYDRMPLDSTDSMEYSILFGYANLPGWREFFQYKLSPRRRSVYIYVFHTLSVSYSLEPRLSSAHEREPGFEAKSANTFVLPQLRTNLFQNSFFPRTISSWNSLPSHITTTPSTTSFKRQLLHYITELLSHDCYSKLS